MGDMWLGGEGLLAQQLEWCRPHSAGTAGQVRSCRAPSCPQAALCCATTNPAAAPRAPVRALLLHTACTQPADHCNNNTRCCPCCSGSGSSSTAPCASHTAPAPEPLPLPPAATATASAGSVPGSLCTPPGNQKPWPVGAAPNPGQNAAAAPACWARCACSLPVPYASLKPERGGGRTSHHAPRGSAPRPGARRTRQSGGCPCGPPVPAHTHQRHVHGRLRHHCMACPGLMAWHAMALCSRCACVAVMTGHSCKGGASLTARAHTEVCPTRNPVLHGCPIAPPELQKPLSCPCSQTLLQSGLGSCSSSGCCMH